MKKKLAVIINNRANYARIKSFLIKANKERIIKLEIILGASALVEKFGNLEQQLRKDGLNVSKKIYSIVEGDRPVTMAKTTAIQISELANLFENIKPDFVLAIADRYETLSVAVASSYMNIPLLHLQGGEITGSIDESVRHAISKFANVHFPATLQSKKNLIKMGENPNYIFNVGCPSIDLVKKIKKIKKSLYDILYKYKFSGQSEVDLKKIKDYIIVVQHSVTTSFTETRKQILETIKAVSELNIYSIWLWPNVDSGSDIISKELRKAREKKKLLKTIFLKNISPEDFLIMLNNSRCIVGNSSVGIRESSFLGIPSVNIGDRQNGREKSVNVVQVKYAFNQILKSINIQCERKKYRSSKLYGNGNASNLMINIIKKLDIKNTQKKLYYKND